MVRQTRAVLERYRAAGGEATEVVLDGVGHSPHLERPEEFRRVLLDFLSSAPLAPTRVPELGTT